MIFYDDGVSSGVSGGVSVGWLVRGVQYFDYQIIIFSLKKPIPTGTCSGFCTLSFRSNI